MSAEFQNNLWRHNLKPTDIIGGLPLDVRMTLDQLWQWRIWFGRGTILMPPEISNLQGLMAKYWDRVKSYQDVRLSTQEDLNTGLITPTAKLHFNGREWRDELSKNWGDYTAKVGALEQDREFEDAIDAMTPEGQVRLARELGFSAPVRGPMEEAVDLYFSVELKKKVDKYTGDEDWDYLAFWLGREAVRMALTEDQRNDFDAFIRKYETPVEKAFRYASETYLRGYRAVSRILIEDYSEEEKALIAEYYADGTSRERKDEIMAVHSSLTGSKLISGWNSRVGDAKSLMRTKSPKLDFWLYVFGYITKPKTTEAQEMVRRWEDNRSSMFSLVGE